MTFISNMRPGHTGATRALGVGAGLGQVMGV